MRALSFASTFLVVMGAGCSKAPNATPPASVSDAQTSNNRIQSIQNDPRMSPADKEKALAILKSRQSGVGTAP